MQILITGATGFIGRALITKLVEKKYNTVAAVRAYSSTLPSLVKQVVVGNIQKNTDWETSLESIDVVIHTAARVHVINDTVKDPLAEFREANVYSTLNFARQAAAKGVKRFIFISSIKVNGESTMPGKSFSAEDEPGPIDPYGISKWESEVGLHQLTEETNMEVVIIRPPLVYGPGVKANFQSMMRWISRGLPLPLGAIDNKRSLISLDNLMDLIITCIKHPAAANQTFLASDGEDLSTTELLQRVSNALGRPARLIPIPTGILIIAAKLLGKYDVAQRLLGSLQVDITKTRDLLNWQPPVNMNEALQTTAQAYLQRQRG